MSDVIGKGVIEVSADSSKLKAGIDDAKRSIKGLGEAGKEASSKASASIDRYIQRLEVQQKTASMSAREAELYKLSIRGASDAQLKAADSALKLSEAYKEGVAIGDQLKSSFLAIGLAAGTGLIAASVAFDNLVKKAGDFQDMAEKTGDSAENIASLAVAAGTAGVGMDTVVGAANKLTKGLTGVDDESQAAGAAISALGINLDDFKQLKPADQMEAVGKALNGFEDGASKSAVAMALFGKSGAEILPFLKELGSEGGRQVVLTEQQIQLADEYADKQAKLKAQIELHASAIATEMLPSYNDLTGAFVDLLKGMNDVGSGADALGGNSGIEDFADDAVRALAFIVDSADGVARVFSVIGKTIAGVTAMAINPISQTKEIYKAMAEDIDATLIAPTLGGKLDARISSRDRRRKTDSIADAADSFYDPEKALKTLNYNGTTPKSGGSGSAGQIAKSALASDLQGIKSASDEIISTYANAEKIMEAKRAAGLLDEKEYYAAKLSFLQLNSQAQEQELQNEIDRLGKEKLTGKEKIDNDKKIAETQAKLNKVRADAAANTEVLSIQEAAANEKIAKSYVDATTAANEYIDTIIRRNQREVEGIGSGTKYREDQSGKNSIEDKLITEKSRLNRDLRNNQITQKQFDDYLAVAKDTYEKETALYDERTARIDAKNAEWTTGASEALQNYYDEARNIAKQTESLFTSAFQGMEDALVEFCVNGKADFSSLAKSILADLVRIQIKAALSSVTSGLSGLFSTGTIAASSSSGATPGVDFLGSGITLSGARASGGPVSSGGTYLVGEKGPELLTMGSSSGHITPNSALGMGDLNVTVNNSVSDQAEATVKPRMNNGSMELEVIVQRVLAKDMNRNGPITQGLSSTFGLARAV